MELAQIDMTIDRLSYHLDTIDAVVNARDAPTLVTEASFYLRQAVIHLKIHKRNLENAEHHSRKQAAHSDERKGWW